MCAGRTVGARLCAVWLVLLAGLPGPLELVHDHAGGRGVHVHGNSEELALRELLRHHEHAHGHAHSHPHPHDAHAASEPAPPPISPSPHDGPVLRGVARHHVHGLNPFQVAAPAALPAVAVRVLLVAADTPIPSVPPRRVPHAARSRGPPVLLVG